MYAVWHLGAKLTKGCSFLKVAGFVGLLLCMRGLSMAQIPTNPYAPNSSWPEAHGTYCQQNSSIASLTENDEIIMDTLHFPSDLVANFNPGGVIISDFYENSNTYCCWGTNGKSVYKIVCTPDSTTLITKDICEMSVCNSPSFYGMMDINNFVYFMSDFNLIILKDGINGDSYSEIEEDSIIDLSAYEHNDDLRGIKMLYSGQIVITSTSGTVIVLDRLTRSVLYSTSLHEPIENNMAVDEGNNVYINTNSSLNKFHWNGDSLELVWDVFIAGSGTTPTLIGTTTMGASEQLLAITDKSYPSNLILIWKDSIPNGWAGLPLLPHRIAAMEPVTFNVPNPWLYVAPSQNSLVVEDNSILLVRWTGLSPSSGIWKPGIEKWTWNPNTMSLTENWVNIVSCIPNAMPCLSTSTDYFYAIGEKFIGSNKYWTFEALDWITGVSKVQQVLAPHANSDFNVYGSGVQMGPFGEIITTSPYMILRFRKAPLLEGINKLSDDTPPIKVSPNPSSGVFTIALGDLNRSCHIDILNSYEQLVYETPIENQAFVSIDLSKHAKGFYYIKVRNENGVAIRKVIVE